VLVQGFAKDAFEGIEIAVLLEQRQSGHGTIEDVIDEATRGLACVPRHGDTIPGAHMTVKKKELRPLFLKVGHTQEALNTYNRISRLQNLNATDRAIADTIMADLLNAVNTALRT
jgi:hypothetical protein